jgi:hypothetical protein
MLVIMPFIVKFVQKNMQPTDSQINWKNLLAMRNATTLDRFANALAPDCPRCEASP